MSLDRFTKKITKKTTKESTKTSNEQKEAIAEESKYKKWQYSCSCRKPPYKFVKISSKKPDIKFCKYCNNPMDVKKIY